MKETNYNQPMPRGGARPGSGRKSINPRTERFATRCTPAEKERYNELKAQLDKEAKAQTEQGDKN